MALARCLSDTPVISPVRQAAILCGGLGSRLGKLTRSTPKPLLPVGARPFLSILIDELVSQGVCSILLLAAFENAKIRHFAEQTVQDTPGLDIQVSVEPDRAGTGGALWHGRDFLQDRFYLLNGDSWLDAPVAALVERLDASPDFLGALSLRSVPDRSRYGTITLDHEVVREFGGTQGPVGPGLINAGVYLFRHDIVKHLPHNGSLESNVLPFLARAGALTGLESEGYFIDIGVPHDFERAQTEILRRRAKPTLLIDPSCNTAATWVRQARQLGGRVFFVGSSDLLLPEEAAGRIGEAELRAGRFERRWPVQAGQGVLVSDDEHLSAIAAGTGFRVVPLSAAAQF